MKQRFSSLDVKAISLELDAALTSLRVSNIYDLSSVSHRICFTTKKIIPLLTQLQSAYSSSNLPNRMSGNSLSSTRASAAT